MQQCSSQTADSMLAPTLLLLLGLTVTGLRAQPYPIPPTCYSKVLAMGKEITQRAAQIKTDLDTYRCTAHLPNLYMDIHVSSYLSLMRSAFKTQSLHTVENNVDIQILGKKNACVMPTMISYLSLLDELREQRCSYTTKVKNLRDTIRQLYIFMSQKCHGDLVFTRDNCRALHHRRWRG